MRGRSEIKRPPCNTCKSSVISELLKRAAVLHVAVFGRNSGATIAVVGKYLVVPKNIGLLLCL